jgi:uncharacterized protein (TIGR03067 family)
MVRTLIAIATLSLVVTNDMGDDLARLQGTWKLTRDHWGRRDHQVVGGTMWVVKGDTLTIRSTRTVSGTIRFDPTKKPARFEATYDEFPDAKKSGTYLREGDVLKLYSPNSRADPPTDLPEKPARGYQLEIWQRIGNSTAGGFEGSWKQVDVILSELHYTVGTTIMEIKDNHFTTSVVKSDTCKITIDDSSDPKKVDLIFDSDSKSNDIEHKRTELRVYRLEGNRLTIWQGLQGRPSNISDAQESENHFQVFEKKVL